MKKLFALILAAAMLLTMAACNNDSNSSSPVSDSTPESQSEPSGETTEWTPVNPGKLTVATSADYAPFEWHMLIDGKDTIVGFDMMLAQQIADDLGLELEIVDMAFENVLTELTLGKVDLGIAGIVADEERAKSMDFSQVYNAGSKCIVIRTADAEKYTDIASLAGVSVGAQTNSIEEGLVKSQMPESLLVSLQAIPTLVMEIKGGTVEAICIESTVANGYVKQNPDLTILMDVPGSNSNNVVAVGKGNQGLLDAVNGTITKVLENGQMEQFIQDAQALADQDQA